MKIKKGDYFDLYQDGEPTRRVIAIEDSYETKYLKSYCKTLGLKDECHTVDNYQLAGIYPVDCDTEIKEILGNIFD